MADILDFFSKEAGQARTKARDEILDGILGAAREFADYYLGPTGIPQRASSAGRVAAEMNPVVGIMDAMKASGEGRYGDAALETAMVLAPAYGVTKAARPVSEAIQEVLLGASSTAGDAGKAFVERMNQRGPVPTMYSGPAGFDDYLKRVNPRDVRVAAFDVSRRDASSIFGEGTERVRYTDPQSGGTIEVVTRPDGSASVLELEVPEKFRGQGVGQSLQERVMQDFPKMGGQVSSKAAATTAYRLGRRPYGQPDATLEDVFAAIDDMSSVNLVSPAMQPLPTPRNDAEAMAKQVLEMRAAGRAGDVTEGMMAAADPQYMFYNTPLPMDEASRMARAGEMGFDARVYHGSRDDITSMDQSKGSAEGGAGTLFSSDEARVANTYATKRFGSEGENVLPLLANVRNYGESGYKTPFPFNGSDVAIEQWLTGLDRFNRTLDNSKTSYFENAIRSARNAGQAGTVIRQVEDDAVSSMRTMPSDVFVTLDPTTIRSRFARFDPAFAHLKNLSAATGIPVTGLLGYSMLQDEQQ